MIAFGFFTEIAALMSLIIFSLGFLRFELYMTNYFSYLGELLILFFLGMRRWSLGSLIFGGLSKMRLYWERYEITIIRIFYGVALIYAAITVKFLHSELTLKVALD